MLRKPGHHSSLTDEIAVYRRQMGALLLLLRKPATAAAAATPVAPSSLPTTNAAVGNGNVGVAGVTSPRKSRQEEEEEEAGTAAGSGGVGQAAGGNTTATDLARGGEGVAMIVYLVLERCSVLAGAGYTLQAAAEALGAVGGDKPLQGWDAPDEDGRRASLLRAPSTDGTGGGRLPKVRDALQKDWSISCFFFCFCVLGRMLRLCSSVARHAVFLTLYGNTAEWTQGSGRCRGFWRFEYGLRFWCFQRTGKALGL